MPKNLLLADDSITIQKVVGITFAGEDFSVTAVDNGEDAIARARELKPDVILADVVMPRKNGYEVCEAIKSDDALKHIPVLLLAGTFEAFDDARARAARADGHIAKPFESQALINKVKELLSGGAPATQPAAAARPAGTGAVPLPSAATPRTATPAAAPPVAPSVARPAQPPVSGRPAIPIPPRPSAPTPPRAPAAAPPQAASPPRASPASAGPSGFAGRFDPFGLDVPAPRTPPVPSVAAPTSADIDWDAVNVGKSAVEAPALESAAPPTRVATVDEIDFGDVSARHAPPAAAAQAPLGGAADDDAQIVELSELEPEDGLPVAAPASATPAAATAEAAPAREPAAANAPATSADGGEAALRAALTGASREVIERIAWEIVPQLAETILREQIDRLVKERQR